MTQYPTNTCRSILRGNLFDIALTYLNVDSGSLAPEGAVRGAGSGWRVTASLRAQVP